MTAASERFHTALRQIVGPDQVLVESGLTVGYATDWTGRWSGRATAVVRPGTVEEVVQILDACRRHQVAVVPQGGNTGLVGGSIPHEGEIVLSMRRMNRLEPVDRLGRQVTAGAGVTIAALHDHARAAGMAYGVDLGSRDSATVGGTIATNAGGMGVVTHGSTRNQVLGVQAVLADGSVVTQLSGVAKQSSGPDLTHLLVGSEGTLGVITAARLRLVDPPPPERIVTLVGVATLAEGLALLGPGVTALEFFDRACLDAVVTHRGLPRPLEVDHPFYVIVESSTLPDLPEEAPAVVDGRVWSYRESITETLSTLGVPLKLDVSLPLARLDEFARRMDRSGTSDSLFLFGHLAEGNFHVNIMGAESPGGTTDDVLGLVIEMGGAIAGEHGIGVAKSAWWRRSLEPGVLAATFRIKRALDPDGLLNPAVLWGASEPG